MDRIFEEVSAYYAPYPELSDLMLSHIAEMGTISSRKITSRYSKEYAPHRVVRARQNLISLGLISCSGSILSLRVAPRNVPSLKAFNFTQTQMRILTFIRVNGMVYYSPFYMLTRANRTPFNQATKKLINLGLLEMRKETTKRGGIKRHVYAFKTNVSQKPNPAAL